MITQYLKSRLLLPIYAALIAVAILQAILLIGVSTSEISSLQDNIVAQLNDGQSKISSKLEATNTKVEELSQQMGMLASDKLSESLTTSLSEEREFVSTSMGAYLVQSASVTADIMSQLAPPFYWDDNIPELTRMVQMANEIENIVFAVYLNKDNKPMTRFLDRKKPMVQLLIKESKVRGSVNKVLDASSRNDSIIRVSRDVISNGVVLGRFVVGVSRATLEEKLSQLNARFDDLVASAQATTSQIINEETSAVSSALLEMNDEVQATSSVALEQANKAMEEASSDLSFALLMLVSVISVLLLVVIVVALGAKVLNRINVLRESIWDIAEGEGDLTQRANIQGNDEITDMAEGLNQFIENTQQVVAEVNSSVSSAAGKTSEMASVSQMINGAVDTQRRELDSVSSAMSQMASTVQHVSDSIHTTSEKVESINGDADKTSVVAGEVRVKLNDLMAKVNHATTVVDQLNLNTSDIGSVLGVIQGIAEQTNLLALNAAIEAARAGESGRGFAVVADEVRALAGKTQQSTEEIEQIIQKLQSGSSQAVEAIQDANTLAGESIQAFAETDQLLDSVHTAVGTLFEITSEIASMSSEQAQVADEIERNIVTIHSAAEETMDQINRTTAASSELESTVDQLRHKASRFKV